MPVLEDKLTDTDITTEEYREYEFYGRVYRIDNPQLLIMKKGGTTHRVLDNNGVVHCVPGPGTNGCVLRWKSKEGCPPVAF